MKEKICQVCGEVFHTHGDGDFCPLPRLCRYSHKNNEYVTIVDVKGDAYGDKNYYYVLNCKLCGSDYEARREVKSRTGFSPLCFCLSQYSDPKGGTDEWRALGDRPRIENKERLSAFESLDRDESFDVEACMNCANFETQECNLTDIELSLIIDLESHICDKFKWWK